MMHAKSDSKILFRFKRQGFSMSKEPKGTNAYEKVLAMSNRLQMFLGRDNRAGNVCLWKKIQHENSE